MGRDLHVSVTVGYKRKNKQTSTQRTQKITYNELKNNDKRITQTQSAQENNTKNRIPQNKTSDSTTRRSYIIYIYSTNTLRN